MFSICDVLLVNKIDVAPYFNFDLKCVERVKKLNRTFRCSRSPRSKGEGHRAVGRLAACADEGLERISAENTKTAQESRFLRGLFAIRMPPLYATTSSNWLL